jgi:hypothetical protein
MYSAGTINGEPRPGNSGSLRSTISSSRESAAVASLFWVGPSSDQMLNESDDGAVAMLVDGIVGRERGAESPCRSEVMLAWSEGLSTT